MRVGIVGTGKLGFMVALTIESCGHEVKGYDISSAPAEYLKKRAIPFQEEHSEVLLANTKMEMVPLRELCEWAEILFLAPQTPHHPKYEGVTPLPDERVDFDYSYLKECCREVSANLVRPTICAVISTVLPGTIEREVLPLVTHNFRFVYTPQFIAMGTVYSDFLNPEFWLIGGEDETVCNELEKFYATIDIRDAEVDGVLIKNALGPTPTVKTDIKTAEGIKVFYNTFITTKTVLANLYGEAAHRLGMNVDDIFKAITLSTRRLLSPRYLKAGMGDGGGCHPRDNIALSYLARKENFSFDFFDALMTAREKHCEWLADLIEEHRHVHPRRKYSSPAAEYICNGATPCRPVVILGRSFKPETNIEAGSPALLLSNILRTRGIAHCCEEYFPPMQRAALYFVGTQHERYKLLRFPVGSVVIDPFRYLAQQDGVTLIQIGAKKESPVPHLIHSVASV